MADPRRAFTVVDRTTISLRLRDGWGIRMIARSLGRSPGTISDEVNRNGGALRGWGSQRRGGRQAATDRSQAEDVARRSAVH